MRYSLISALGLLVTPTLTHAAQTDTGSMLSVFLSLFLILGGFVFVAWLVRRYMPGVGKQGVVKVIGATMVGPRERVVVVEVENTWLLLGVGAGQVRLLDKLNRPESPPDGHITQTEPI